MARWRNYRRTIAPVKQAPREISGRPQRSLWPAPTSILNITMLEWARLKICIDCADCLGCRTPVAPSPSGKAADCKSAIPGSNPGGASLRFFALSSSFFLGNSKACRMSAPSSLAGTVPHSVALFCTPTVRSTGGLSGRPGRRQKVRCHHAGDAADRLGVVGPARRLPERHQNRHAAFHHHADDGHLAFPWTYS